MKTIFKNIGVKKIMSLILSAVMVFSVVFFAVGCGGQVESITLNITEINLVVGRSRTITDSDINFEPVLVRNRDFVLISSDNSIFTANNQTSSITAVSAGRARLTIQTVSNGRAAHVYVNVSDIAPSGIEIISSGNMFQNAPYFSQVEFFPHFDIDLDSVVMVSWTVVDSRTNQEKENKTIPSNENLSFMPPSVGSFSVTASVANQMGQNIYDTVMLRAFNPFETPPDYFEHISGLKIQENASQVSFEVDFIDAHGNPERQIEWRVNGEIMGNDRIFRFTPYEAGQFFITLYINNENIPFNADENYALVTLEGVVTPRNLFLCTIRNFPLVTLYFDTNMPNLDYEIMIYRGQTRLPLTISTIYTPTQHLFNDGQVNLTQFIGYTENASYHILNTSFTVQIRSAILMPNAEDSVFSDWAEIENNIVRNYVEAIPHLENTVFDGHRNHFVQNEDDFTELFAHFFKWRERPRLQGISHTQEFEIFICDNFGHPFIYPFVGNEVVLRNNLEAFLVRVFRSLGFTGEYNIQFGFGGDDGEERILFLTIRFDTDGLPSQNSSNLTWPPSIGFQQPHSLQALRPLVNTDFSQNRQTLPIDTSGRREVVVHTSEQLYFVIERGFRPNPAPNSEAYPIYHQAREIMKSIVPNTGFGQVQTLQAIYDYLIWRVSYDHRAWAATGGSTADAVRQDAYYLEGVFGSDPRSLAVCDGITKAFILLAGLENIPSIRVFGQGYVGGGNWGYHAWNKVKVYGEWFIVDATWGVELTRFTPFGTNRWVEVQNRRWFLLTDRETVLTHREDERASFPRTSLRPINAHALKGFYISGSENHAVAAANSLVDNMLESAQNAQQTFYVGMNGLHLQYQSTAGQSEFIAFELRINRSLEHLFSKRESSISNPNEYQQNPILARFRHHNFNNFNMTAPEGQQRAVHFKIVSSDSVRSPQGAMFVQIIIAI
ncbi:MAG: hypothetical protein FWE22_00415 [Firmicutes bacterium]|nr:hypothetical protein [Bacillota bacterium]